MSDYISREEAVKRIDEALRSVFVVPVGEFILSKLPAADVAEVVRCKNCRFCVKDGTFEGMWCRGERVSPEYYCAGGKREEKKDKQDEDGARIIADVLTSQYDLWKSAINELCVREADEKRVKNEMAVEDNEQDRV